MDVCNKLLCLVTWILWLQVQCTAEQEASRSRRQTTNDAQPRIVSNGGHLVFQTGQNHNITFRSSQGGYVNVDGENINAIVQLVKNNNAQLQELRAQQGSDTIVARIAALESTTATQIQQLTDRVEQLETATTAVPPTVRPAVSSSAFRRLTRRVSTLESRLRTVQRNLVRDNCRANPCRNGGTCEDAYNSFVCRCPPQWEGPRCQTDTNECAVYAGTDLGCQNGATCTNTPGGYSCACTAQWHGVRCTETHDDCTGASNEALCGHGTCVNQQRTRPGEPKYHCICDEGWSAAGNGDPACSVDVDECNSRVPRCSVNPPVSCINVPGSYHCGPCPNGYSGNGHACVDIDECIVNNGGCSMAPRVQCINTLGSSSCGSCPPGYTGDGRTCGYASSCSSNNGGCHPLATCMEGTGFTLRSCTCPQGYIGSGEGPSGCVLQGGAGGGTSQGGACANVNCGNGRCQVMGYSHVCVCAPGWAGVTCSENINECASSPCQHGAACIDGVAGYTCQCTQGYTGANCQTPRQGCGDRLIQQSGAITYPPVVGEKYPHGSNCEWTIITSPDKVLLLSFTRFKLEEHASCSYDYVELMDGADSPLSLGRFCGQTIPSPRNSTHNSVVVKFRSDASESHDGFELHWSSVTPVCGGRLRRQTHGVISSPGYPGNYPNNRDCVWVVMMHPGKKILFTLGHIAMETHDNCTNDYLQIRQGMHESSPSLGKYCSTQDPAPVRTSTPYAHIRFHSDQTSSDRGFQISFTEIPGAPGCGGNFTAANGVIISPNYPNPYPARAECVWTITVAPGERVTLTFTNVDLQDHHNCLRDFVEVRDGDDEDAAFVGRYCDTELPPAYRSSSNSLWLRLHTDSITQGSGFRATWNVECGGTFTTPTGELQSPYFPNPYPSNRECIYVISQPAGTIIMLTFAVFDIEASRDETCRYDYLEVRDGESADSPLISRLCGPTVPGHISSTSNALWLKFKSDGSTQNHGFQATYTNSEGGGAVVPGGGEGGGEGGVGPVTGGACGGALSGISGTVTSPGFPNTYPHGVNCTWWITVPPGFIIRLTFTMFQMESHSRCAYDYVKVYDNSTEEGLIGRYCGSSPPPVITSSDNVLTITFTSDGSVSREGFSASYIALNATTVCGGEQRTSMGVISSPMYPDNYPSNRDCEWVIVMETGLQILLNITDFQLDLLGGQADCNRDYVEIRNGGTTTSPLIGKYCGTTFDPIIRSHSNRLYIKFHSDGYRTAQGFTAIYDGTLSGCGGALSGPSGSFVSPNFPLPYGHNAECYWSISVAAGSKVHFHFSAIDLEQHSRCIYDYVEVWDTVGGTVLGRFCGNAIPQPVESPTNTLYVKFRTDYSSGGTGFHANYHANCNNRIRGHSGAIESPNFPNPYLHAQDCTWVIEATVGNTINASFSHFNIEQQNGCHNDYLEVRDGESGNAPLVGRYCGTDILPPSIASTQRYLYVHFVSNAAVSFDGFRLEYIIDGCGGEFRAATGAFMSPNYPNQYPNERECLYSIVTPPGTSILLTLQDFDVPDFAMEPHQNCQRGGALEIYGGLDTSSPVLATLCHTQASPQVLTSTGNHMLLRFRSDNMMTGRGFSAVYRTLEGGCGGFFSTPSGTIMSKDYPSNYPHSTDCVWLISLAEGNTVLLTFQDLDIEGHANCTYDYVAVYDGADYNATELIKLCGSTLENNTIVQTTNNKMFIRMRSDTSVAGRGFKASYVSGCGGTIVAAEDGAITSPNYPSTYPLNQNCTWTIRAPTPGQKITLTLTHLDLEELGNCSHDAVTVLAGDDDDAPMLGTYCGTEVPAAITSPGAALTVKFRSDESDARSGFRAVYTTSASACGGTFTSEHGSFNSPGFPDTYPHNVECVWEILTSPGNRIMLTFREFSLEEEDLCNNDYVEVREGGPAGGTLLGRYCGTTVPINVTVGGHLLVKFHSNEDTPGYGFRAQYNSMYGGEISGIIGNLASPLAPQRYPPNAHYVWTITVPTGQRVLGIFSMLDMEEATNCLYDYVQVQDGGSADSPLIGRYCVASGRQQFVSNGNQIYVVFHSDSAISGRGFWLNWSATNAPALIPTTPPPGVTVPPVGGGSGGGPISSCDYDVLVGLAPTPIFSPGYPNGYAGNLACTYRLTAPPGYQVWINLTDVDLEAHNSCNYDKVTISSRGRMLARYCDHRGEGVPLLSLDNTMIVQFSTDSSVNRTGFAAQVKIVCGGYVEATVGALTSPGFPAQYPANQNCTWTIKVMGGRTVAVTFESFDINPAGSCSDSLTFYNGIDDSSPVLGGGAEDPSRGYCGSIAPSVPETSSNYLSVRFVSDASGSAGGFNLTFREKAVACGGQVELTEQVQRGTLNSPNYPENYPQNVDCVWVITAPPNNRIALHFEGDFHIEPHVGCEYDFVEIRDGGTTNSPQLGQHCGTSRPDSLVSSGHVVYVRFRSDNSVMHAGFQLTYAIGSCGGSYSGQSGILESPNYPGDYGPDVDCAWKLTAPTGHYITFTFVAFNLEAGRGGNCTVNDFLQIRDINATGDSLGEYCGATVPAPVDTSDSTAHVRFHSNGQGQYSGFRIKWNASIEVCGGEMTTPSGVITSPNYPGLYPHRRRCVWRITVPEGRRVTLTFNSFDLEEFPRCTADFVMLFNGIVRESPVMAPGLLCGSDIPGPFESSSNSMTVMFKTDGSDTGDGFMATYHSDNEAICGGTLPSVSGGTVTSPGFDTADSYNHSTQCVWTLTNPRADNSSIQILFDTFMLESHGQCLYDFLEIREGTTEDGELIGRFCDNSTLPPPIASPSPSLTIRFVADYAISDRGFQLNYFFTSCGGILTASSGVVTSPNYPQNYNHGDSCAWKIVAPEGTQIRLQFSAMQVESHENCEYDYVEVFNGGLPSSPSIGRFCGNILPTSFLSQSNQLRLEFHTDSSSSERGFQAQYSFVAAGCGGLFHGLHGSLSSPGWPLTDYQPSTECIWDIVAEPGYHLIFSFTPPFDMQRQDVCQEDYVEISNVVNADQRDSLGRYCGNVMPPQVNSTSYMAQVKFRADADIQGKGFGVNYTTGCGAVFTATEGFFHSPGYPNNYAHNLTCNYTIIPPDPQMTIVLTLDPALFRIEGQGQRIYNITPPDPGDYSSVNESINIGASQKFDHLNTDAGFLCIYDKLEVFKPTSQGFNLVGKYCGYTAPQPIVAHGGMTVIFSTDHTISDKGFKALWTMETCGGTYNASAGQISTPAHPFNYHHNANCTWLISVQDNQVVDLKFNSMDIEPHSLCRYDYVAVYNGDTPDPQTLIGRYCGNVVPAEQIRSTGSSMLLQFVSDRSVGGGGFLAAYRAAYGESVGCGGVLNATSGSIRSVDIDGDGEYEGDLDCIWQIIVPENFVVHMHFNSFSLESSVACERYDHVQIRDGFFPTDPMMGTYCGRNDVPDVTSSSNALYVYFHTDSDIGSSGFTANFTAVPRLCGGSYQANETVQNITSPGYPGDYPSDTRCRWTIDAPSRFQQIEVKVVALEIEAHRQCYYDYLEIRDAPMGDNGTNLHICGTTIPPHPFISVGRTVHINMVTDNNGAGHGFFLQYSIASCNRTFESDHGRIVSPNWPAAYPPNSNCVIDVIAPVGQQLAFFFNFLHIEAHADCQYDYLQISDSSNFSSPLATVCGPMLPDPVFASTNHVQLRFVTDTSIMYSGYDITYISSLNGCGGNLTAALGSFSSPDYPRDPNTTLTSDLTCYWNIKVPRRKRALLKFTALHIGVNGTVATSACGDNYVKVFDGSSTSSRRFGTYCGTELPAVLQSTERDLTILYHVTSNTAVGLGFLASYSTTNN